MKILSIQNHSLDNKISKKQIKFGDTTDIGGFVDKETPLEKEIRWLDETRSNKWNNLRYFLEKKVISKEEYYKELDEISAWYKKSLKEIKAKYQPAKVKKSFFARLFK